MWVVDEWGWDEDEDEDEDEDAQNLFVCEREGPNLEVVLLASADFSFFSGE